MFNIYFGIQVDILILNCLLANSRY